MPVRLACSNRTLRASTAPTRTSFWPVQSAYSPAGGTWLNRFSIQTRALVVLQVIHAL